MEQYHEKLIARSDVTRQEKSYITPCTGLDRPWGFQEVEASKFHDNCQMEVVRLSALHNSRLYLQEMFLVLISIRGWVSPGTHTTAGRITSMKNSSDIIGNR